MLKYILIILLFGFSIIFPQRSRPIYFEDHIVPADSEVTYYLSYRIPYNNLVFIRQNGFYTTGINLNVEAKNTESEEFFRANTSNDIRVENYEETESEDDYAQGVVKLKLPQGNYSIFPSLKINNVQRDINFKPMQISTSGLKKFLEPVVVNSRKIECGEIKNSVLVNFGGDIPFSDHQTKIIIPAADSLNSKLNFKIFQEDSLLYDEILEPQISKGLDIAECKEGLVLKSESEGKFSLYTIEGVSRKLSEGPFRIEIYEDEKLLDSLSAAVEWVDKPASLYKVKDAIDYLALIAEPSELKKLKSADDEERYKKLFKYWKAYDPTPETAYNEIMAEFYKRVDEADKEFSSADDVKGSETDRGEIYIKYGTPDSVDRFYSDEYSAVEIWKYDKLDLEFAFADKGGLGNFKLLE